MGGEGVYIGKGPKICIVNTKNPQIKVVGDQ